MCKESKGLINLADKLGRTPLLAGLMAGAGLEAVMELVVQGEDPSQEDEVGRGAPEAAILYCDNKVIQYLLEQCCRSDSKVELNKKLLSEIAEDHVQAELVKEIIERTCS